MNLKNKRNIRKLTYHLIKNGRIKTSVSYAKGVARKAERLITKAKKDTVRNRRYVAKQLPPDGVKKLFEQIGPVNINKKGGYTRRHRLYSRKGDGREMCVLEIIDV